MCNVLKAGRSAYYKWLGHLPSKRELENINITQQIALIHKESRQTYGSPRITMALQRQGIRLSRPRVARLMRKADIHCKCKRRFVVTTDSKHKYPVVENVLNRNFKAERLGKIWVSDLTYIPTGEGWLYLTTVIDMADRKVIGWALSETMKPCSTSVAAYQMAIINRPVTEELIFHSDRGIQYACNEFKTIIEANKNIVRSMSRKGDCWDNAVAESFFKTFKAELVFRTKFQTIEQAKLASFDFIEIWYNRKRLHSSLGYRSPEEMEQFLLNKKMAA
jgi:transposase InsO family protein